MGNARQRGTGVRIRSEAKAAAADRLLLAAQDARDEYDALTIGYEALPKRRIIRRRQIERARLVAAVRHMQAIRSAQEIAKKGKSVDL